MVNQAVLQIPPVSENVRLVRLLAVSAAWHAGISDEDVLDDVRIAVAEATTRAILRHAAVGTEESVCVVLRESPGLFQVTVTDRASTPPDPLRDGLTMAVITGLVPDTRVETDPDGGESLHVQWPVDDPAV